MLFEKHRDVLLCKTWAHLVFLEQSKWKSDVLTAYTRTSTQLEAATPLVWNWKDGSVYLDVEQEMRRDLTWCDEQEQSLSCTVWWLLSGSISVLQRRPLLLLVSSPAHHFTKQTGVPADVSVVTWEGRTWARFRRSRGLIKSTGRWLVFSPALTAADLWRQSRLFGKTKCG